MRFNSLGKDSMRLIAPPTALSIYVHYPYCSRICTFCAFNKYEISKGIDESVLLNSCSKELEHNLALHEAVSSSKRVRSVYFGGGTPSLCPRLVDHLLQKLRNSGYSLENAEVTLEANPTSLPEVKYLSQIGVTRVSLGVQSLVNNEQLRKFNREHSTAQSVQALERLAIDRILLADGFTFDLMFSNPVTDRLRQDITSLSKELQVALPFAEMGGHLSLYELTVEKGTPLAADVRTGVVVMPDNDKTADEYEAAVGNMQSHGFDHYEVSSFAQPGRYGRHNFAFWMHEDLVRPASRPCW